MYIDFIDTLRNIQSGIYPQIKIWHVDIKNSIDENNGIKDEILKIKGSVIDLRCDTKAIGFEAESWANEDEDVPVKDYVCAHECDTITSQTKKVTLFSSKHWAAKSKGLSEVEKWEAEAAQMTAWSFANQDPYEFVSIYTSNGDGTFASEELKDTYSAKHWGELTEQLSGQKRWVETQKSTQCQSVFVFGQNIHNADVYINGIRQTLGACYSTVKNEITFTKDLNDGDVVTVSGMEAVTGDYYQDSLDEMKSLNHEAKMSEAIAEASMKTAKSFTSEAIGHPVKIYTADANGHIHSKPTQLFSSYHWSSMMNKLTSGIMVVDTYADLNGLNSNEAKTVYVRGGLEINDGREGIFIYDMTHGCKNDGGIVINGYVREYNGPVDLNWFLATGDGITDDTAAFRAVIDTGEDILIRKGNYVISSPLEFRNIRVVANQVTISPTMDDGRAITCSNMNAFQGIYGALEVEWEGFDKKQKKVSFFIQDCEDAQFDIGSIGANIGIEIDPEFGHVEDNVFNIKLMKNNIVGIYVGNRLKRYTSNGNKFYNGEYIQSASILPRDNLQNIAGFIIVADDEHAGLEFILPSFRVGSRTNDQFQLFRIAGREIYIEPAVAIIEDNGKTYGTISGKNVTLNASNTPNLVAYLDNHDDPIVYQSTIDISGAEGLTIIGRSQLTNSDYKTIELVTDGPKASSMIMNKTGLASYYPVAGIRPVVRLENTVTKEKIDLSPSEILINGGGSTHELSIKEEIIKMTDGVTSSSFTKKGIDVEIADVTLPLDTDVGVSIKKGIEKTSLYSDGLLIEDMSNPIDHASFNKNELELRTQRSQLLATDRRLIIDEKTSDYVSELSADKLTMRNSSASSNVTGDGIFVVGRNNDNFVDMGADGEIDIQRDLDKDHVLQVENIGKGGVLDLRMADGSSPAISITSSGQGQTIISGDSTWVIAGKKIQWTGLGAPVSGSWQVGDMVFGDEPIVNGSIGWVCVQQGTPGKWKAFGEVDIHNTVGIRWRNLEVDFTSLDGQDEFVAVNIAFDRAKVYVNGSKIRESEFTVLRGTSGTKITLKTPCEDGDWVSVEY